MVACGWVRLGVVGCGWVWLGAAGCGWVWLKVVVVNRLGLSMVKDDMEEVARDERRSGDEISLK